MIVIAQGGRPTLRRESMNKSLARGLRSCNYWLLPLINARQIWTALRGYAWYFRDWHKYSHMPGAEVLRLADARPLLNDRTGVTPFDAHYFYRNSFGSGGRAGKARSFVNAWFVPMYRPSETLLPRQ